MHSRSDDILAQAGKGLDTNLTRFFADRIIVLEKGRVIEDGTQAELLKNRHRYAELFRYQQEKYMVEEEAEEAY